MKNKILPFIKLEYFGPNGKGKKPADPNLVCNKCNKKGISLGAANLTNSKKPYILCEDCAIDDYKEKEGFSSRKVAESWRRRIFDIQYLFVEMVVGEYLKTNNLKSLDDLDDELMGYLLEIGRKKYDSSFSKKRKDTFERTQSQKFIEKEFIKIIDGMFKEEKPINISLTKSQYKDLLFLEYLGNYIVNSDNGYIPPNMNRYDMLESYLLGHAKKFGLERYADYDKEDDMYYASEEMTDEIAVFDYLDDYEDKNFWGELVNILAVRDFNQKYSKKEINKMGAQEYDKKMQKFQNKYDDEFNNNGIDRLFIR